MMDLILKIRIKSITSKALEGSLFSSYAILKKHITFSQTGKVITFTLSNPDLISFSHFLIISKILVSVLQMTIYDINHTKVKSARNLADYQSTEDLRLSLMADNSFSSDQMDIATLLLGEYLLKVENTLVPGSFRPNLSRDYNEFVV